MSTSGKELELLFKRKPLFKVLSHVLRTECHSLQVTTELLNLVREFFSNSIIDSAILTPKEMADLYEKAFVKKKGVKLDRCQLLFRASFHGYSAKTFHSLCSDQFTGATLTVVMTEFGHVIGGFTAVPWTSPHSPEYIRDPNAWLFVCRVNDSKKAQYSGVSLPAILAADRKRGEQVSHYSGSGPTFGMDLSIAGFCDISNASHCHCNGELAFRNECDGVTLSPLAITGGSKVRFAVRSHFRVLDYEVFLVR